MANTWMRGRVLDASDSGYLPHILGLLQKARREIVISMYLMEPDDETGSRHPVNSLLEALIAARRRGVLVRILLNSNFRFKPKTEVGSGETFLELAGEILKKEGKDIQMLSAPELEKRFGIGKSTFVRARRSLVPAPAV